MRLPCEVRIAFFELIAKAPHIDGAAVWGSIANGKKFRKSDDIDATPMLANNGTIPIEVVSAYGLDLHIKSCIISGEFRDFTRDIFRPQTIYIFRSDIERNIWGAPSPLEAEVYLLDKTIS
ncbi:MAG: hypothetical protein ABIJ34_02830 [archaeon]